MFGRNVEMADFDALRPGTVPQDWSFAVTHHGDPGRWVVHPDITAPTRPNVLAQLAPDRNRFRFALALYDKSYTKNGDVQAVMKVVGGKTDQTGGLVWRYQDANNYYMLHVSANEDAIGIYKVVDGHPSPIARISPGLKAFEVTHRIDPQQWNILRVFYQGTRISVYFDHRKVMDADDATFLKPGKAGVWTKGDTLAYFDDFRVEKKKD